MPFSAPLRATFYLTTLPAISCLTPGAASGFAPAERVEDIRELSRQYRSLNERYREARA